MKRGLKSRNEIHTYNFNSNRHYSVISSELDSKIIVWKYYK